MHRTLDTKPTSIALLPPAADRANLANGHQYYLSPPLTPYPHFQSFHDSFDSISPVTASYHPSLPALQEMLPHDGRQRNSTTDPERFQSLSATLQHPRRESKAILKNNMNAMYTGGQIANGPARLLSTYSAPNHTTSPPPAPIASPMLRRNKAHVASACVNCKKAHLACDAARPCRRCVSLDKQDTCVDVKHKRRGRPRLKDTAPSTNTGASESRRPSYLNRPVSDDDWKAQSGAPSSHTRDNSRREYPSSHHNRSFSQGSQVVGPRHHPYANPTAPTSAYVGRALSRTSGYFDIPLTSYNPGPQSRAYPHQPGSSSPSYYPYRSPQLPAAQEHDSIASPVSPYHPTPSSRSEGLYSGPGSQHLLPLPEATHPGLMRRGSFPSIIHQSDQSQSPQRSPIFRTGSGPTEYPGHDERRGEDPSDSVKLPSLKDLGVPYR